MNKDEIWLIGSGQMAVDYVKVLEALEHPFKVIGRGEASASLCQEKTGAPVIRGGLSSFLASRPPVADRAIVAVNVDALAETTLLLIESGVRKVLVEKPAGLNLAQLTRLKDAAKSKGTELYVAYNRRFYASTLHALRLIEEDGGLLSCNFEFTEWGHVIEGLTKGEGVKERWFLSNSTHVADLAFHLAGMPRQMNCYTSGALPWHQAASVFAGAGVTERGVLFSYQANWGAPGRWGLEALTANLRLIFRPMESLQVMRRGSVRIEEVEIDDSLDKSFKPGIHQQTRRFVEGEHGAFCTLDQHLDHWNHYCRMGGYHDP